jgi:hypothetical protein
MEGSDFLLLFNGVAVPVVELRHVLVEVDLEAYPIEFLLLIGLGAGKHVE